MECPKVVHILELTFLEQKAFSTPFGTNFKTGDLKKQNQDIFIKLLSCDSDSF